MKAEFTCSDALKLIPKDLITNLEEIHDVNYQVSRLKGEKFFTLLLFSLIGSEKLSLRVLEELYNRNSEYKALTDKGEGDKSRHSSISDRLNTINPDFFEDIFLHLSEGVRYSNADKKGINIVRFDSTLVSIAASLLKEGMKGGSADRRTVKYTLGLGNFPTSIKIFTAGSEETALKASILEANVLEEDVVVFDRGVQRRETFVEFDQASIRFVTRLKDRALFKILEVKEIQDKPQSKSLTIEQDLIVQLKDGDGKWVKTKFRLIIAKAKNSEQKIQFLTNIQDLDALAISEIYKKRWEIEVFFKYLKQHLNLKHFLSRNLNGIAVMIYMVLIVSTLVSVYKAKNKISSYKIAKLRFKHELEKYVIKEIIKLCGGDPKKFENIGLAFTT